MERDESYYVAVDLLKRLIAVPSLSREEAGAADLLERMLRELGHAPQRIGNNVLLESSAPADGKPVLLLNSHLDTVRPVAGWQRDPFSPLEEDGRLYGLGSNDAGAPLVSLLSAALELLEREQPYRLVFVASAEEEVSGKGGIESVLPHLPAVAFGVVGEPTGMRPAVAEKGLMVLDCTVRGRSGHAARNEGINAIYEALPLIEQFRDYRFSRVSERLGAVKMTVTQVAAGTQHNVVPDRCDFTVDVRTNECYRNEEVYEQLREAVPCEIRPRSFRLNSSGIDPGHPFVQRCVTLGLEPFGSPTLSDQALMDFPTVKIGPGDSARSHSADEFVRLAEIREAIPLYVRLLDGLRL